MKVILPILIFLLPQSFYAQCIEGDCENGYGKSDLFYAEYQGTFLNGIPDGAGTLNYDEYRYEGQIKKGLEHGIGIIFYNDGSFEEVNYEMGKKIESRYEKVNASNWQTYKAKREKRCISGDCANGKGVYEFASGNRYDGNFVNFQPEGYGSWEFANGEKYIGNVQNGMKNGNGKYYFSKGWTFEGVYKNDSEHNGTYTTDKGKTVKIINGVIQIPKPKVSYSITSGGKIQDPSHMECPMCSGTGKMIIPGKTKIVRGSAYYGSRSDTGSFRYTDTRSSYSVNMPDQEKTCSYCSGNGVIKQ